MTRAELVADLSRQLEAKLAAYEAAGSPPGSIILAIHLDSDGPRKVVLTTEEGYRLPR